MGLRIEVLGALRVGYDVEIALERASYRRLLSILALEANHRIGTDVLIDRFWGEAAPATAKAALQVHISALRKLLPSGLIVTEGYGYRLDLEGHGLDVDEFVALAHDAQEAAATRRWETALEATGAALALWRGDPYPELEDDDFARSEIARLREFYLELLEARAETLLGMGRNAQALPDLERLVVEHPLRERFWEHLMTARYRLGRHAEALEAYREAWSTFREIGLEPSASLTRLEQKILLHDTSLTAKVRNNLPVELTAFVGRERELAEVAELLAAHRMVTLTGVGGTGKTRLALRVAASALEGFPDGCWVAELASLRDDDLVALEVIAAVDLRVQSGDPLTVLAATIADDTTLIVLDNCEHLVAGCARVARVLLEAGPEIKIVATSREPLRVPGEVVYEVPPMSFPDDGSLDVDELLSFDAIALFTERAGRVRRTFALDTGNAEAVGRICGRLDGLPLAIELAAARVGPLDPGTIADRLDDRFRILVGGSSTGPKRHRTLEAALAWSYDLLDEQERIVLAGLSVFRGGFTLDMAEEVCGGTDVAEAEVVSIVAALADKSLVATIGAGARRRYRLLETVRDFAAKRLPEVADPVSVRRRHLDWCVRFAGEVIVRVFGNGRWELFERLDEESDNLQAALEWAREPQDTEILLRVLAWHWWDKEHLRLAISALEAALSATSDPQAEAEIRALLGAAQSSAGNADAAFSEMTRAFELVAGLESSPAKVWVLERHASFHLLLADRDPEPAVPLSRAAVAEAEAIGDPVSEIRAQRALARSLVWNGALDEGLQHHHAALHRARALNDPATLFDTYALSYDLLYLHPVARRSEPSRVTAEILSRFDAKWATHAYRWRLPYVFCQSGEWDRAEAAIEELRTRHLEGYDRVGYLIARATLRWMQGRVADAQANLDELYEVGVNPRWYHDYYPLAAEIAADAGRLADVRAAAERYRSLSVHRTEEARKLAVLSPLARAEVDAALVRTGGARAEHVQRAQSAVIAGRRILEELPPPTDGSPQMETHRTYLALGMAELSRATVPQPARWHAVLVRADFCYFRLYARLRLAESLFQTGRVHEAEDELRNTHQEASRIGADRLRGRLAALAARAGVELADALHR